MAKKTEQTEQPAPNKLNLLAPDDPRRVNAERERRRVVKRTGGLVKDLSEADTTKALKLCDEYGRSYEKGWDLEVSIPNLDGYVNPAPKKIVHK
jgi:hypothetical protein